MAPGWPLTTPDMLCPIEIRPMDRRGVRESSGAGVDGRSQGGDRHASFVFRGPGRARTGDGRGS